jgi:hypothetical protein
MLVRKVGFENLHSRLIIVCQLAINPDLHNYPVILRRAIHDIQIFIPELPTANFSQALYSTV